jgi:hypothetical protein
MGLKHTRMIVTGVGGGPGALGYFENSSVSEDIEASPHNESTVA